MNKLGRIIKGWKNVIITDQLLEPLFQQRFETCVKCNKMKTGICTVCGCVCWAKSHSPEEECPESKWKDSFHQTQDGNLVVIKANLPENLQQYFEDDYITEKDWIEFLKQKENE